MSKMLSLELGSRWFCFNHETGEFDYTKTEEHVFGKYDGGPHKLIKEMDRKELIQVLAATAEDRDNLAKLIAGKFNSMTMEYMYTVRLAQRIVDRMEEEGDGSG